MLLKKENTLTRIKDKGITLIELLVVITIMMTMIALVAPLGMDTVDKAEAQSEYLSFCGVLRHASIKAFVNGSSINIKLNKNTLIASIVPLKIGEHQQLNPIANKIFFEHTYKYLNFSNSELKFNKNGMPNVINITFNQRHKVRELDLTSLLKN